MISQPEFPLLFTDEEGVTDSLPSVDDLGVALEFVDDFDPPYECRDKEGRRVRVIVWDLELLTLQVVPNDFDANLTEIEKFRRADGTVVWVERFRGEPLRSVAVTPGGDATAEPETWQGRARMPAGTAEEGTMEREKFNSLWMKAKGFKR